MENRVHTSNWQLSGTPHSSASFTYGWKQENTVSKIHPFLKKAPVIPTSFYPEQV